MSRPADVVAVDLGGTTIKAARFNAQGVAEETLRLATPSSEGPEAVVAAVVRAADGLVRPGTAAVGLCAPGLIDADAGVVRYASNLGLRETPLAAAVAHRLRLPVTLEHDVRAAGLAEQRLGLGAGVHDLLVVVLGTGVPAGIVSNDRLVRGAQSFAGEFGHIPVHADGELCACGQHGCLEAYSQPVPWSAATAAAEASPPAQPTSPHGWPRTPMPRGCGPREPTLSAEPSSPRPSYWTPSASSSPAA